MSFSSIKSAVSVWWQGGQCGWEAAQGVREPASPAPASGNLMSRPPAGPLWEPPKEISRLCVKIHFLGYSLQPNWSIDSAWSQLQIHHDTCVFVCRNWKAVSESSTEIESRVWKRCLHTQVHSSIPHNSQKVVTIQGSRGWTKGGPPTKWNVIQP